MFVNLNKLCMKYISFVSVYITEPHVEFHVAGFQLVYDCLLATVKLSENQKSVSPKRIMES